MYQETQYDDKYNREHQYDFVDKQSRGIFLSKHRLCKMGYEQEF